MISVVGTFTDKDAANLLLADLAEEGLSPTRIAVSESDSGEIRISVGVDESDHEGMMNRLAEAGADRVRVDTTLPSEGHTGAPTLTDTEPPSPIDGP